MIVWGIKNKLGFLIEEDGDDYGTLLDAKLFKLKKDAQITLDSTIDCVNYPESLVKIEIKEIK